MDFTGLPDGRGVRYPRTPAYANRHDGQLESAQRRQVVQAVADFLPNGTRARNADARGGARAHSGPVSVRQGKSTSSITVQRPVGDTDRFAVPSADADFRQADYFLGLLVESRRELDRRIDEYRRAVAIADTRGAVQRARGIRRVMRIDEHERQTVQELIACLQRRFPLSPPGDEVPSHFAERRLAAR
jgi:hypothetical protein